MTRISLYLPTLLTAISLAGTAWGLTGRILEKAMNQPVPGATVKWNDGVSVVTDTSGRFTLETTSLLKGEGKGQGQMPGWAMRGNAFVLPQGGAFPSLSVEYTTVAGTTLSRQAWTRPLPESLALPEASLRGQVLVFANFQWEGGKQLFRLTRQGLHGAWIAHAAHSAHGVSSSADLSFSASPLAKASAAGTLAVTKDKLVTKTVNVADGQNDVGDIILDYPARKLDTGATPPYGALVLFDGRKGKAAAQQEMQTKWQDWVPNVNATEKAKYTKAANQFKIAKDPQYPNDTNRVTLQSCCDTIWGYDDLQAKETHGDVQLHVEWIGMGEYDNNENANAADPAGKGQKGYVNSGVYIQSRYEIQIESRGVSDDKHTMGSMVDEFAPSSFPERKLGEWQAYDIVFRTARYNGSTRTENARVSVWWNGVLVHDNRSSTAPATGTASDKHSGEDLNATLFGLKLQSEGRDVRYRNIWMKPLKIDQAVTNVGY